MLFITSAWGVLRRQGFVWEEVRKAFPEFMLEQQGRRKGIPGAEKSVC